MTPRELIRRKRCAGFSDLQLEVLLALAEREMTNLTDLCMAVMASASGVSGILEKFRERGLVHRDACDRPYQFAFFWLTEAGKREVSGLLGGKQRGAA